MKPAVHQADACASATASSAEPPLSGRSVALVHEWFGATGGSEQVFLRLADVVPHAQRYVLWRDHDAIVDGDLRESWLARTPLRHSKALALPVMPVAWRTLTRDTYDVVISSSHAFAHTVRAGHPATTRYLSYVHSPARYVWSPQLDGRGARPLLAPVRKVLQAGDRALSRHVHSYAANSREVRERIRRYWRRDARVINPPVDVDFFAGAPAVVRRQERCYLLGVGRWIPYKRFDLVIEIAAEAGLPLVLAGSGPEEGHLRRLAEKTGGLVSFEVSPSRERLRELYWGARCLLYPGHEDFGMIPVEAQACGCPVIGLARGGLTETVVDGLTGYLVPELRTRAFVDFIPRLGDLRGDAVRANAGRFTVAAFEANIKRWLAEVSA